jgi:2-polyprenyl-3-methyl-5-hydroxy-6-metoxy-1,4-benzoquinol methylase
LKGISDTTAHELTTRDHWDSAWQRPPRWRLPSKLFVSTRNLQRVIEPHVRPGMRYLEIGCAPGKMLAWVARELRADVSGLDYSQRGMEWARRLFDTLGLRADLRCEDVWSTTFPPATFDVVFSAGLIEHFDDPGALVRLHVNLVKPGGRALITIPNYGGVYGRLQAWFDPDNLGLHNLSIMRTDALKRLAPGDLASSVRAYPAGRISPWLVSIGHRWPGAIATGVAHAANAVGLIQPMDVAALCPLLVLDVVRGEAAAC